MQIYLVRLGKRSNADLGTGVLGFVAQGAGSASQQCVSAVCAGLADQLISMITLPVALRVRSKSSPSLHCAKGRV